MENLLEAVAVARSFAIGGRTIQALPPVSVSLAAGDFLVITGPSGSGKSTLLNILSGLDRPSEGVVRFKGRELTTLGDQEMALLRNGAFGFMFQTPHLLPEKTVAENVGLPHHYGHPGSRAEMLARCQLLLEYVGMAEMADRYPHTLSGGEMQRVVFARALAREPQVIFADEPTGSLDSDNAERILDLLQQQANGGRAVVMVTHDEQAASRGSRFLTLAKISQQS